MRPFHRNSTKVLVGVEPDGTRVYRHNNKIIRATPDTRQYPDVGFYPPGGRAALYRGCKDPRNTPEFAEGVRELRSRGKPAGVRPGPQSLSLR
jgi:hypothetical protein